MLILNPVGLKHMQIMGSHDGVKVAGMATLLRGKGTLKDVWHFRAIFTYGTRMVRSASNIKDDTMWDTERLSDRIKKICTEIATEVE